MSLLSSLFKDVVGKNKQAPASATASAETRRAAEIIYAEAKGHLSANNIAGAEKLYAEFMASYPGHDGAKGFEAEIHARIMQLRLPGPDYREWLKWFHARIKPENYLEIGVETGESLQYANMPTRCIGIDPEIAVSHTLATWAKLFKLTSDDFFKQHDARQVCGGGTIDMAFIDGMHTFDQALKDFINTERYSSSRSVALFHDILPIVPSTALRERETTIWIGDTWKVLLLLKKHRPDLNIFTIPAQPSGLAVVTNLNPSDNSLIGRLDDLIREGMSINLDDHMGNIYEHLNVVSNDADEVVKLLGNL